MATIAAQTSTRAGIDPTMSSAAGGGDKYLNSTKEVLLVRNNSGSSINVTIDAYKTVDTLAISDRVVAVGAAVGGVFTEKWIGPFPKDPYNDDQGYVNISYSGTTNIFVAVIKLGSLN